MSAEEDQAPSGGDRPLRAGLVDLGVNTGRMQREDGPAITAEAAAYRVVIDVQANGDSIVYSDLEVPIIYRCAQAPEDELVQVSHRPIPEEWLDRPIGYGGDGSVADLLAEVIATWPT